MSRACYFRSFFCISSHGEGTSDEGVRFTITRRPGGERGRSFVKHRRGRGHRAVTEQRGFCGGAKSMTSSTWRRRATSGRGPGMNEAPNTETLEENEAHRARELACRPLFRVECVLTANRPARLHGKEREKKNSEGKRERVAYNNVDPRPGTWKRSAR